MTETSILDTVPKPSKAAALAIASSAFIVPTVLSAGTSPSPDHPAVMLWYRSLRQPKFKPPDAFIPIAWTGIEAALATACYRLVRLRSSPSRSRALGLLATNIVMIGGWSRLFFKRRSLAASTVAASAMIVTGAAFVREANEVEPTAAKAGVPFVAWVAFATVLTASIWRLNRK
jgi:benzodiazapine receptor